MKKTKFFLLFFLAFTLLPEIALATGGDVAPLVIVADTRNATGLSAWFGNLYNESHFYFTLLTVIVIPIVGVVFGVLADVVMRHLGIDLKSRELAEH